MPALPSWARSVRFRLALVYSSILFGLAALLVAGVYIGVSRAIEGQTISRDVVVNEFTQLGPFLAIEQRTVTQTFETLEGMVNQRALDKLRDTSAIALAGLFPVSVLIGWLVAGRVLRPIGRITSVAREIQATDLARRIHLQGPDDEIKQLADTFDDMLGRIEDSAEQQRAFIHDTSHELRNPLAVMATNLDVVMSDDAATVEDFRSMSGVLRRSIDRITTTVEDLLTYARQGTRNDRAVPIEVGTLVDEVVQEFHAPAAERDLRIVSQVEADLRVLADESGLRQALQNLVGNAVRLAPMTSQITVGSGSVADWVWIGVADEGPGIPEEQQNLVWQRYWRADGPGRSTDPGRSGLGLAIVRQVAEAHAGAVQLHSERGRGSTFVVWLPSERPVTTPAPLETPNPLA